MPLKIPFEIFVLPQILDSMATLGSFVKPSVSCPVIPVVARLATLFRFNLENTHLKNNNTKVYSQESACKILLQKSVTIFKECENQWKAANRCALNIRLICVLMAT